MTTSELITPQHLALRATIYVRQSTLHQTLINQESLELQYALKKRAIELGWQENNIEVIDDDLGLTGADAKHREGFKSLLTQVTLGEVGIILSFDVTRLSRNCSDWYPLLDICGYRHCLIADREGVYDPSTTNGRLLLGLKGQLAEVELNTIRARLTAGLLNKAQRGDLALSLPVGLIRDSLGRVEKDPHQEVQSSIQRVFDVFLKAKTIAQTLVYFNRHGLEMPRYDRFHQLQWRKPTMATLSNILHNPTYAGMFVYGKTRTSKTGPSASDKVIKKLPRDQWKIVIPDKYPAYISKEMFDTIQEMLKQNYAEYNCNKTRGIPRDGAALLQGIVFCGECGHKMVVQYKNGNRYLCNHLKGQYRTPVCQNIPADPVDQQVVEWFFQAISPIEINAYEASLEMQSTEKAKLLKAQQQKIERLHYQAQLAESQFNQVNPNNRLVAVELEKRWEHALCELQEAQQELTRHVDKKENISIPDDIKVAFENLGRGLSSVWDQTALSRSQRKALLRCLIDKVVVHREKRDCVALRVVWKGGEITTTKIRIHVGSLHELSSAKEMEEKIMIFSQQNKKDKWIAEELTKQGYCSPMKSYVLPSTVQNIRLKHKIFQNNSQSHPLRKQGYISVSEMAEKLGVDKHWIYDRINNARIKIEKVPEHNAFLFPDEYDVVKLLKQLKNRQLHTVDFRKEHQDA